MSWLPVCGTCGKPIADDIRYLDAAGRQTHLMCDPTSPQSGAERYFAERMKDPAYAAAYHAERERLSAVQKGSE